MLGRVTGYLPFRIEVFGELRSIWSSIRFFLPVTFLPITKAFAVKHIKKHFLLYYVENEGTLCYIVSLYSLYPS